MDNLIQLQPTVLQTFNSIKSWITHHKWTKYLAISSAFYIIREFGWYMYRKYNHLPPGPNGLPFVGTFFHDVLQLYHYEKYGPICYAPSIAWSGALLCDSKLVKQLYPQKEFMDRFAFRGAHHSIWDVGEQRVMPLVAVNGDDWSLRRQHVQTNLIKTMNNEYVDKLLHDTFDKELVPFLNENKIWFPREMCEYLAFNTIYCTLFGESIKRDSKLYNEMKDDVVNTFKYASMDLVVTNVPFLCKFKYFTSPLDKIRNRRNETILRLIHQRIEINNNINDDEKTYIDHTHELVMNSILTQEQEIADTFFLFMAGTDTTASTLHCGIALIAKYIDIQQMVRDELLSVMNNVEFNIKLVHNCPLFRALVYEILRISSVARFGVNRICNSDDCWIETSDGKKYKIPKGTVSFPNIEYIHIQNNAENWKKMDKDKIFLENWLSSDRKRFVMNQSFVGFGVGRRDCVGRQLAIKEIQIILGYLLMHYQFKLHQPIDNILKHRKGNLITMFIEPPIAVTVDKL